MAIKRAVSLYSLRDSYRMGKLDLEGMVKTVAEDIGVHGIELLGEMTPIGRYPDPTPEGLEKWNMLKEKYQLEPTTISSWMDTCLYSNRDLRKQEMMDLIERDLKLAAQLGFTSIRSSAMFPKEFEAVEACLPMAETYGVKIAMEIHMPRSLKGWQMMAFWEMIQRTGTKFAGFIPDFGVYTVNLPVPMVKQLLRHGADEKIVEFVVESLKKKGDKQEIIREARAMGAGEKEESMFGFMERYIYDDPEWLREIADILIYVHGKFYEVEEGGMEESIDYANPLRVLQEIGYDGYICSEYEGQGYYTDKSSTIEPYTLEVQQVKNHQAMLTRLLGE